MLSAPATIANLAPIFGRLKIKGIAAISVIKTARNSVNQSGDTLACDLGSKPISKTVRTSRATTVRLQASRFAGRGGRAVIRPLCRRCVHQESSPQVVGYPFHCHALPRLTPAPVSD